MRELLGPAAGARAETVTFGNVSFAEESGGHLILRRVREGGGQSAGLDAQPAQPAELLALLAGELGLWA